MVSNLKSIYQEKYEEFKDSDSISDETNEEFNIDLPKGWSFICLNETINYYTESLEKN